MWATMKSITNMTPTRKPLHSSDDGSMANELNNFYLRFDTQDFSSECNNVINTISIGGDVPKIDIDHIEVTKLFKRIDTNKAAGPDGVSSFLLKTCAEELTPAWAPVFQRSVDSHSVPSMWKMATIIPLPKKAVPRENNDYRPVALTSIVVKCLEKLMVWKLKSNLHGQFDPYQFAYRDNRGTDEAILTITHSILQHLENPQAYARLLFVDFSSAFNTVQPHILFSKLKQMSVNPYIIRWYHSFLTNRTQQVRVNQTTSQTKAISTGVPQGCVSSPPLFTVYTEIAMELLLD